MSNSPSGPPPRRGSFPPGIGWLPLALALLAALAISAVAVAPQFSTKIVGATGGGSGSDSFGGSLDGSSGSTGGGGPSGGGSSRGSGSLRGGGPGQPGPGQPGPGQPGPGQPGPGGLACTRYKNGGNTAPGVTDTNIFVGAGTVTTGIGSGFLGEAHLGLKAALAQVNSAGGICGRKIFVGKAADSTDYLINTAWDRTDGQRTIQNLSDSNQVFALVAQPDTEGLDAAVRSGLIDRAQLPVVGTDGLLKSQYNNPWIWPVAASTATNMHIIAQYAKAQFGVTQPSQLGIVFETRYKFGPEGAKAFNEEIKRVLGTDANIPGFEDPPSGCKQQYCGIDAAQQGGYGTEQNTFNSSCKVSGAASRCWVVVMLLEPTPMQTWMGGQGSDRGWYRYLFGGEPLFDDRVAKQCSSLCDGMRVWTGYHPNIQPFDGEKAVQDYCRFLHLQRTTADCRNVFTQGAYLGAQVFIEAVKSICNPQRCEPLTRSALRNALNSLTFDLKLSDPFKFGSDFPRVANRSMAAFQSDASGRFNGWTYLTTGFVSDPNYVRDLEKDY